MKELTRTTRAYYEQFLARVADERSEPFDEADIERILAEMRSEDEDTRAKAVRKICPCRMSPEVFYRLRKAAKPLQKDSSPLVRANARHIEQDARMLESFESQIERVRDYEEAREEGGKGARERIDRKSLRRLRGAG